MVGRFVSIIFGLAFAYLMWNDVNGKEDTLGLGFDGELERLNGAIYFFLFSVFSIFFWPLFVVYECMRLRDVKRAPDEDT